MPDTRTHTLLADFAANQAFLLRLARKLARDEHAADDLVQRTWLAALEHPPASAGRIRSWMAIVVRNLAINESREEGRRLQREGKVARAEDSRAEEPVKERLERQQEVLRAVLELREPYRSTIVARYSDGLAPTEIARRDGIPLATVKARLARGLALLREHLDRRFDEARSVWLAPLLRGIADGPSVASLSPWTLIGSWMMAKKWIVVVALLVGVLGTSALLLKSVWPSPSSPLEPERNPSARAESSVLAPVLPPIRVREAGNEPANRELAATPAAPSELRGEVIDGRTRLPIEGARIALYSQREMTFSQLMREFPEDLRQWQSSVVTGEAEWFDLPASISPAAILGREAVAVSAPPLAGATPQAETMSDSSGQFSIALPLDSGVLMFEREGYGTRRLALAKVPDDFRIELWSAEVLEGQVIDAEGEPLNQALDLYFTGQEPGRWFGGRKVRTNLNGSFTCRLPSEWVAARCLTPGWTVVRTGVHPEHGPWVFPSQFRPGAETEPVYIVVSREASTTLHVVDEDTDEPISEFWLLVRDESRETIRDCGYFFRPRGEYALAGDSSTYMNSPHHRSYLEETRGTATVWTATHAPTTVPYTSALSGERIEVRLLGGDSTGVVRGRVVDGSRPLAGVELFLRPFRHIDRYLEDPRMLDHAITDEFGAFELRGPAGSFSIQVNYDGEALEESVVIPSAGELIIDVAQVCTLELTLRNTDGAPCANYPVSVNGSSGRQQSGRTDELGVVRFESLGTGPTSIYLAHKAYTGSWRVDEVREIDFIGGQTLHESWILPALDRPVFPRILLEDAESAVGFEAWRARAYPAIAWDWVQVGADGTIPIDVQEGKKQLFIEGTNGRKWRHEIEERPDVGYTIRLRLAGAGYEGTIRNRVSGEPYRRIRVFAAPVGENSLGLSEVSVLTDSEGRFSLSGLADVAYNLSFSTSSTSDSREATPNPLSTVFFQPNHRPANPPVALELDLPEQRANEYQQLGTVHFAGLLIDGSTGEVAAGGSVHVTSLFPSESGVMELFGSSWQYVDDQGAYSQDVPRAPRYQATCGRKDRIGGRYEVEWDDEGEADEVIRDVVFGRE